MVIPRSVICITVRNVHGSRECIIRTRPDVQDEVEGVLYKKP